MPPARQLAGSPPPIGYLHSRSITVPTVSRATARIAILSILIADQPVLDLQLTAAAAEAAGVSLAPSPAPVSLPCPRKGECSKLSLCTDSGGRGPRNARERPRGARASAEGKRVGSRRWAAGSRPGARQAGPGQGCWEAGERAEAAPCRSNLDFARSFDPGQNQLSLKEVKT